MFDHSFPACAVFSFFLFLFFEVEISSRTLIHSLCQDQSTLAQRAETTVAECSMHDKVVCELLSGQVPNNNNNDSSNNITCRDGGERDVMIDELSPLHVHDGTSIEGVTINVYHPADVSRTGQRKPVHTAGTRRVDCWNDGFLLQLASSRSSSFCLSIRG